MGHYMLCVHYLHHFPWTLVVNRRTLLHGKNLFLNGCVRHVDYSLHWITSSVYTLNHPLQTVIYAGRSNAKPIEVGKNASNTI